VFPREAQHRLEHRIHVDAVRAVDAARSACMTRSNHPTAFPIQERLEHATSQGIVIMAHTKHTKH